MKEQIKQAVAKYNCEVKEWKGFYLVLDKKGRNIGHVKPDGTVKPKRVGSQVLMGSLIRNAIKEALSQ